MSKETVLVIRSCAPDMTAHGGFKWPESGPVECHDWIDNRSCGNGLHGLDAGFGNWNLVSFAKDAKWLVVEVDKKCIRNLVDKVKFPRGNVVYCGNLRGAANYINQRTP